MASWTRTRPGGGDHISRSSQLRPTARQEGTQPAKELIGRLGVGALVSAVDGEPVRLRREAVTAHTEVLRRAFVRPEPAPSSCGSGTVCARRRGA